MIGEIMTTYFRGLCRGMSVFIFKKKKKMCQSYRCKQYLHVKKFYISVDKSKEKTVWFDAVWNEEKYTEKRSVST